VNGREPFPNARQSANITCVGILAHESAMQDGKQIPMPEFTLSETTEEHKAKQFV
jgi:hypothetical protein